MTMEAIYRAWSNACLDAAEKAQAKLEALGPRPDGDPQAAAAWDAEGRRILKKIQDASRIGGDLAAAATNAAIGEIAPQLRDLEAASKRAQEAIKEIEELSRFLAKVGQIVDVGVALVDLAAGPSAAKVQKVVKAVGKVLGEDKGEGKTEDGKAEAKGGAGKKKSAA